jgi:hypothetical protein
MNRRFFLGLSRDTRRVRPHSFAAESFGYRCLRHSNGLCAYRQQQKKRAVSAGLSGCG